MSEKTQQLQRALGSGTVTKQQVALAAYLGYRPAQELLGEESPVSFSLQSMQLGGDRRWRQAMRTLGHEPVAQAAVALVELAFEAYLLAPDSPRDVASLASEALTAFRIWVSSANSEESRVSLQEAACVFCLAVKVGGRLYNETHSRGRALGQVFGMCWSAVLASPNDRRYVRYIGVAAEEMVGRLGVSEATLCREVSKMLVPHALGETISDCQPTPKSSFGEHQEHV